MNEHGRPGANPREQPSVQPVSSCLLDTPVADNPGAAPAAVRLPSIGEHESECEHEREPEHGNAALAAASLLSIAEHEPGRGRERENERGPEHENEHGRPSATPYEQSYTAELEHSSDDPKGREASTSRQKGMKEDTEVYVASKLESPQHPSAVHQSPRSCAAGGQERSPSSPSTQPSATASSSPGHPPHTSEGVGLATSEGQLNTSRIKPISDEASSRRSVAWDLARRTRRSTWHRRTRWGTWRQGTSLYGQ